MNRKVRTIFLKELRDMLRDRRTIFATAVIPVLLYPLMTIGISEVSQLAKAKLDRETFAVAVMPGTKEKIQQMLATAVNTPPPLKGLAPPGRRAPPESVTPVDPNNVAKTQESVTDIVEDQKKNLPDENKSPPVPAPVGKSAAEPSLFDDPDSVDTLKNTKFDFQEMTEAAARDALAGGKIRAVLMLPPDFESRVEGAGRRPRIILKYDRAERVSQSARNRLVAMLERYESSLLEKNLKDKNLTQRFLHPFSLDDQSIAKSEKVGGSIFGSILPLIFIVVLMTGALHPAVDMTAGEKERSTLETLVGSPARPLEIIAGKFLAVSTLSLMNAFLNVVSFAFTIKAMPLPDMAFPWSALPLTLLLLLPLAMFFSALLLMVASFAANTKEAQIFCMPVFLIPVVGMAIAMTPGIELEGPLLLTPVVNTSLLIKEMFLGHGTAQQIAFVFFSTCLYACGMVALAARVFAREEVLFSAQGSLRLFLSRRFFKSAPTPKAGDALLAAALLFPMNFYVQSYLQKLLMGPGNTITTSTVVVSVLVAMYGLFLAVPLLLTKYLKADFKTTFQWNAPSARALFGALLVGCSAWIVALQLVNWQALFWEPPQMKELEHLFDSFKDSYSGMAALLFLIAVTPALCEEHFFRGFLQQGLQGSEKNRARNKWTAILLTGAIFGFFHIPVFRQPITGLVGVVLAWTAYETCSLWPGVLIHFLYNAMSTFGLKFLGLNEQTLEKEGMPLSYVAAAFAVTVLGLWIIRGAQTVSQKSVHDNMSLFE